MPPKFLLHQAFKEEDGLLNGLEFCRCSGIAFPFGISSFERGNCVFNATESLAGIRFYYGQHPRFSPGMTCASHPGLPFHARRSGRGHTFRGAI